MSEDFTAATTCSFAGIFCWICCPCRLTKNRRFTGLGNGSLPVSFVPPVGAGGVADVGLADQPGAVFQLCSDSHHEIRVHRWQDLGLWRYPGDPGPHQDSSGQRPEMQPYPSEEAIAHGSSPKIEPAVGLDTKFPHNPVNFGREPTVHSNSPPHNFCVESQQEGLDHLHVRPVQPGVQAVLPLQ
eukprot:CAMPEP_0204362716 /NCGR_PEP_ID=MMETSP0469-20131031/39814_1 /ASSEMBLY_ACC=CAM_ASM_000384 /TAXON_ID=2969 /ORGANISM="Oxyrrhis marina" /LENGTH=183 /DNA_ID=CAMNT_0051351351 /DNA_START=790 /DNA_END=1340 /DNA_ORIENTATION=+